MLQRQETFGPLTGYLGFQKSVCFFLGGGYSSDYSVSRVPRWVPGQSAIDRVHPVRKFLVPLFGVKISNDLGIVTNILALRASVISLFVYHCPQSYGLIIDPTSSATNKDLIINPVEMLQINIRSSKPRGDPVSN